MRKSVHRLSFYTLILAVYGVFFSVESFYNFEGHSDAREIIRYSSLLHSRPADQTAKSSLRSYPAPQKSHVRLNKRFHPEVFPPCAIYEVSRPVLRVMPRELGCIQAFLLPGLTIAQPLLRGPPHFA